MKSVGLFITIACTVQYAANITQSLLLSVDRQLSFSHLPVEMEVHTSTIFSAEHFGFHRIKIPLTAVITSIAATDYTFNTADGSQIPHPTTTPSQQPTSQPSCAPSGQPSSSPTAAPSVSPQPTNHPSSSGPTNTYKPTVKPTYRPSAAPSNVPTAQPTVDPTVTLTARLTVQPSERPSTLPSILPTPISTRAPHCKPTMRPTVSPLIAPTYAPSMFDFANATLSKEQETSASAVFILLYILGGLSGLWCIHRVFRCYVQAMDKSTRRKELYANQDNVKLAPMEQPSLISSDMHTIVHKRDDSVCANIEPPATMSFKDANGAAPFCAHPPTHLVASAHANGSTQSDAGASESVNTHISGRTGDSSDTSIALSSLHSSEMSDDIEEEESSVFSDEPRSARTEAECSVHSDTQDYIHSQSLSVTSVATLHSQSWSDRTRSRQSAMEEGSILSNSVDSDYEN